MATPPMIPAGWYADPAGRHESRYWDGWSWTAMVSDGGVAASDLLDAPPQPYLAESPPTQTTVAQHPLAQQPLAEQPLARHLVTQQPVAQHPLAQHSLAQPTVPRLPAEPWPVTPPADPADPADPAAPAAGRRHGWWRWVVPAIVVAAALIVGLVIWAPWKSPPVLRPVGLVTGTSTTSSVAFRWSGPPTGPEPDRYVILHDGKVVASVRGTVTSYRQAGLAPATAYQYRVAAVRGGKRSAASAALVVRTATPPISAARLQGQWTVIVKIVRGGATLSGRGTKRWTESWQASPKCPAGACAVSLYGAVNGHSFRAVLARADAVYQGKTTANVFPCGLGSTSFPIRSTLTIRVKITTAQVDSGAWTARSLTGTMQVVSPYTSSGAYYCVAASLTASLSGTF